MTTAKITKLLLIITLVFSCSEKEKKAAIPQAVQHEVQEIEGVEFQNILDSAKVKGAILLYDLEKNSFYSNDFEWAKKRRLPASTFKIPNSIIAIETGVVSDAQTLFKWDKNPRGMKIWERDMIFQEAFHLSCVPCYQEVARAIGVERMNSYLEKFDYGTMQVDSSNIDMFWLTGKSAISQFEQIDFLKRFQQTKLPISKRTSQIVKDMMVVEKNEHYSLSGKTGLSIRSNQINGWFVGYLQTEKADYFFATNIEPLGDYKMNDFQRSRKEVTMRAFELLEITK